MGTGWDGADRRKKRRYGIRGSTVRYRTSGVFSFLSPYSAKLLLLNFSEGGCHFISKAPMEPGADLDLELEAPKVRGAVRARGRVVWSKKSEQREAFHVGVEFRPLSSGAKGALKNMLDAALLDNVDITTRQYLKEIDRL